MATVDPNASPADLEEPTTLRDDIDAAFEQHATDEVDEPRVTARDRDDLGRFAKKSDAPGADDPGKAPASPATPAAPVAGTPGAPAIPPAPQPPELKAPASWTPAAREKWASIDPEVRNEVHRREVEAQRVLQESAGLRQFAQQFNDAVRPYELFIRAEQSDPLRAVQSLMATAAQLRMGSPHERVNIVAGIIQQHGVDLNLLDEALASILKGGGHGAPGQGNFQAQQFRDPRLDLFLMQQQQERAQQEQFESRAIEEGMQRFAETHEFFNDVRDTMADLIDAASKRGQGIDLEKIYLRACQIDEGVSSILAQRSAAQQRQQQPATSQAVLRARRAAVSVKGDPNPEGSTVPKDDTIRASIEAAIDAHSS